MKVSVAAMVISFETNRLLPRICFKSAKSNSRIRPNQAITVDGELIRSAIQGSGHCGGRCAEQRRVILVEEHYFAKQMWSLSL